MNKNTKGYLFASISAAACGTMPLFALPIKYAGYSSDTALFYRFLFGTVLIGLCLLLRRSGLRVSGREAGTLLPLGLLYALSAHFLFVGYDYMPAGTASVLLFSYPVFVALITGLTRQKPPSRTVWGATVLALAGGAVLNGSDGTNPAGTVAVLLSAIAYALCIVIIRARGIGKTDGMKVACCSMCCSTAFFLLRALSRDSFVPAIPAGIGSDIVLFALVATVVPFVALVAAVRLTGPISTAAMGWPEPVAAVIIGSAVFREPLTGRLVAGTILMIGAALLTLPEARIAAAMQRLRLLRPKTDTLRAAARALRALFGFR